MNLKYFILLILSSFLFSCNGAYTTKKSPNLNNKNFSTTVFIAEKDIHSDITDITYQYNVYLPNGYADSNKNYPVIYVTDAQWGADERFAHIVENKHKDIIIVGITQGPEGQRTTDFLWPGSSHYLEFFSKEFLPLVESQYRIDTNNRTLFGHSYGGVLIRHALINEVNTPLFKK
jgi:predicted alpha/beta superfamily hydrolase